MWNVRIASSKAPLIANSNQTENSEEEILRQKTTVDKVCRILNVLSAFEESSAECIQEMLIHFSNQSYQDGVIQAEKFICHIEALFAGLDGVEGDLGKYGDRLSMLSAKEPKQLTKKIVNFFTLLSLGKESRQRKEATQQLITLVTSLARQLKALIRAALNGALKLVRNIIRSEGIFCFFLFIDHFHFFHLLITCRKGLIPTYQRSMTSWLI